jgi:hypothetical protein
MAPNPIDLYGLGPWTSPPYKSIGFGDIHGPKPIAKTSEAPQRLGHSGGRSCHRQRWPNKTKKLEFWLRVSPNRSSATGPPLPKPVWYPHGTTSQCCRSGKASQWQPRCRMLGSTSSVAQGLADPGKCRGQVWPDTAPYIFSGLSSCHNRPPPPHQFVVFIQFQAGFVISI